MPNKFAASYFRLCVRQPLCSLRLDVIQGKTHMRMVVEINYLPLLIDQLSYLSGQWYPVEFP